MGLFSSLFRALVFLCLGLLAYDYYYQGGEHATSLVDTIRDRDSLEQVWRDIPLHKDKLVHHANAAWIEIKTARSPQELIQKFMYKNRGIPKDGDVYILSHYTFDKVVDGSQSVLVKFYAPWCTHCKNLAPDYQRVAEAYKGSGVMIAEVNSQKEGSLTRNYGVKMYPTLLWFPKGVSSTDNGLAEVYAGARDFGSITRFIQQKSGIRPKVTRGSHRIVELNAENFERNVHQPTTHVLVEFYRPGCQSCEDLAPVYEKVAKAFADEPSCKIAKINTQRERGIAEKYSVTEFPSLEFFTAGKQDPSKYDGPYTEAALIKYLNKQCGTNRMPTGELGKTAGRVSELDQLARKFVEAVDDTTRDQIRKQAGAIADRLVDNRHAQFYANVMDRIRSNGDQFISSETERLQKAIKSSEDILSSEVVDEFAVRRNILSVFDESNKQKKSNNP